MAKKPSPRTKKTVDFDKDEKKATITEIVAPNLFDLHAKGCIAGALIGDSCGSYHEFATNVLTEVEMNFCMTMPGGGPHGINPGQCTDDGELTMCLLQALVDMGNSDASKFDVEVIGEWYKQWANSNPFDMEEVINNTICKYQSA